MHDDDSTRVVHTELRAGPVSRLTALPHRALAVHARYEARASVKAVDRMVPVSAMVWAGVRLVVAIAALLALTLMTRPTTTWQGVVSVVASLVLGWHAGIGAAMPLLRRLAFGRGWRLSRSTFWSGYGDASAKGSEASMRYLKAELVVDTRRDGLRVTETPDGGMIVSSAGCDDPDCDCKRDDS